MQKHIKGMTEVFDLLSVDDSMEQDHLVHLLASLITRVIKRVIVTAFEANSEVKCLHWRQ